MKKYEKEQPEQQNYDRKDDDNSSASLFYVRKQSNHIFMNLLIYHKLSTYNGPFYMI
jgi:hypothetical protein